MCTVSFVFSNGKTIITSNRDEKVLRPSAIEPKSYLVNNKKIVFPKDSKAGGTWYAISPEGTVLVLLNGAAEKHHLKPFYRRSRGLNVLDIISSNCAFNEWNSIDLTDIEPFTLVLFENNKLYQLRWNELQKESLELNVELNHIWSSSTLYSREIREERAEWFDSFTNINPEITPEELFNFHRYTESQNKDHGLIINRNEEMKTLSITQTVIEKNKRQVFYSDLITNKEFSNTFLTV